MHKPDLLRPALIGGLAGALLSIVPPLCVLNCCCCLNYILGGLLAGALYANAAEKIGWYPVAGEGATVGVLAGALAGVATGIVSGITNLCWSVAGPRGYGTLVRAGQVDWNEIDELRGLFDGVPPFVGFTGSLVGPTLLGALAGLLGGILGVVIFRREPRVVPVTPIYSAQAAPPVPPSAPPPPAPPAPPAAGADYDPGL